MSSGIEIDKERNADIDYEENKLASIDTKRHGVRDCAGACGGPASHTGQCKTVPYRQGGIFPNGGISYLFG